MSEPVFLTLGTAVVGALTTCVVFLFNLVSKMGTSQDQLRHDIGRLEGFYMALKGCQGGSPCPWSGKLPMTESYDKYNQNPSH